ncbi:dienelactone hydrolase [Phaeosphaeriaceae sp. SRC1lsM3a]|nr:dienelactone hydrolase [Stagonospora sp. SRC1lsM3a]
MTDTQQTFSSCCVKHFSWTGTPSGTKSTLSDLPAYVTGTNTSAAVLYVHDALGWKFSNARLLADHFAREANVTVYMPDFFGGERLDEDAVKQGRWGDVDMAGFTTRNARDIREPEIFECARELKGKYGKVGTVGYCFGGWAVMRLGAKEHEPPLVDCVVCAHPSWMKKEDIDGYGSSPVQFLATEIDAMFAPELKQYAFQKLILDRQGKDGVPADWVHFPGVAHGCLTKGDENTEGEREAMIRGKDSAVAWFKQWLST